MQNQQITELIDKYQNDLYNYAYYLSKNIQIAQDAVQDTFVKLAVQNIAKIEQYIQKWLFKVCRNRVFEIKRTESKRYNLLDKVEVSEVYETPISIAEKKEQTNLLMALLNELPDNEQEIIRLKFQYYLSYKEIAEIMNISQSNVGFILHKVIKSLRLKMKGRY